MPTDTTPEEIERARRWAGMQSPPVTVHRPQGWFVPMGLTNMPFNLKYGKDDGTVWMSDDDVWRDLAIALRPFWKIFGPVIREECAKVAEGLHGINPIIGQARHDAAAAIREMK